VGCVPRAQQISEESTRAWETKKKSLTAAHNQMALK
jgi:hypothetical protein